ncbi:hypothetical protein C8F01DRAFT_1361295 [Mycena amicta]|nr:hypothetical protein C8F01DRAFT_1361295 [Mycena amicta]
MTVVVASAVASHPYPPRHPTRSTSFSLMRTAPTITPAKRKSFSSGQKPGIWRNRPALEPIAECDDENSDFEEDCLPSSRWHASPTGIDGSPNMTGSDSRTPPPKRERRRSVSSTPSIELNELSLACLESGPNDHRPCDSIVTPTAQMPGSSSRSALAPAVQYSPQTPRLAPKEARSRAGKRKKEYSQLDASDGEPESIEELERVTKRPRIEKKRRTKPRRNIDLAVLPTIVLASPPSAPPAASVRSRSRKRGVAELDISLEDDSVDLNRRLKRRRISAA